MTTLELRIYALSHKRTLGYVAQVLNSVVQDDMWKYHTTCPTRAEVVSALLALEKQGVIEYTAQIGWYLLRD